MVRYRAIPARPPVADLRNAPGNGETETAVAAVTAETSVEVSYRDLQARAKELDIPANQSREELEAAIAEADDE